PPGEVLSAVLSPARVRKPAPQTPLLSSESLRQPPLPSARLSADCAQEPEKKVRPRRPAALSLPCARLHFPQRLIQQPVFQCGIHPDRRRLRRHGSRHGNNLPTDLFLSLFPF